MALRTSPLIDGIGFGRGFAMAITSYLDDFDVDPETKRVLGVALEKTRVGIKTISPTESSPSELSQLLRPASATPISYVKAH